MPEKPVYIIKDNIDMPIKIVFDNAINYHDVYCNERMISYEDILKPFQVNKNNKLVKL